MTRAGVLGSMASMPHAALERLFKLERRWVVGFALAQGWWGPNTSLSQPVWAM
jgi:hypothetical protein